MNTPILDFLNRYVSSGVSRFHMPGHKGRTFLGCEPFDITEIDGADSLYEADGVIAQSEANAAALFGSARTLYSTEGSSQCIRAMLYLLLTCRKENASPVILAGRNAHKAFIYAAALLDFEVIWLWPEENRSLCSCQISENQLEAALSGMKAAPAAVYLTSPDYLGGTADIAALAAVCHRHGVPLAVDNAHGAYLHFLQTPRHPLDLGADICCDSAHKTLPVLTGGAYLHISKNAPAAYGANANSAMALFGSTSPSYLILASLDHCCRYLTEGYRERLSQTAAKLCTLRSELQSRGLLLPESDPLRLTFEAAGRGFTLSERLRAFGGVCEYADPDFLVLMLTPENTEEDFKLILNAFENPGFSAHPVEKLPIAKGEAVCSIRKALFHPHKAIPASEALGCICGAPTVSCPPAVPIAVSGERIDSEAVALFRYYGIGTVDVLTKN